MRYRYMDSLRAALMLGGVFFHASVAYSARTDWVISDPSSLPIFDWIGQVLMSFRMPTFFFVAGFFCALGFSRHQHNRNLSRRLTSFVIPALSVMILLQPLQYALELKARGQMPASVPQFLIGFVEGDREVGHLWFLIYLCIYYVLVWLALRAGEVRGLRRWRSALSRWVQRVVGSEAARSKTVLAGGSVLFFLACHPILRIDLGISGISISMLAYYLPFFVVGYGCFCSAPLLDRVCSINLIDWAFLAVLWAFQAWVGESTPHKVQTVLALALRYQVAWVAGVGVVWIFRRWFNRESRVLRSIADSAYTVYLFHHVVVVALTYLLIGVSTPGGYVSKYFVVVTATFGITLALHHGFIVKWPLLRFLFNGRRDAKTVPLPRYAQVQPMSSRL